MVECGILTVSKPAHIIAESMTIDPTDCEEPCNATVTVAWKNVGGKIQTITPAIVVNGSTTPAAAPITLAKNETATIVFNLTGLMEGDYTICPDPN